MKLYTVHYSLVNCDHQAHVYTVACTPDGLDFRMIDIPGRVKHQYSNYPLSVDWQPNTHWCEKCIATEKYKEDFLELEIGYDGDFRTWYNEKKEESNG